MRGLAPPVAVAAARHCCASHHWLLLLLLVQGWLAVLLPAVMQLRLSLGLLGCSLALGLGLLLAFLLAARLLCGLLVLPAQLSELS